MKMYVSFLLIILLFACSKKRDYWDLNDFHLVENALAEGEKFKVIYYLSAGHSENPERAYNHYIVVSEEKGDTVNILSVGASPVVGPNEVYSFSGKYEAIIDTQLNSIDDGPSKGSIDDLVAEGKKSEPEKRKVLRDPQHDDIAKNNWPTVFGSVAKGYSGN